MIKELRNNVKVSKYFYFSYYNITYVINQTKILVNFILEPAIYTLGEDITIDLGTCHEFYTLLHNKISSRAFL